MYCDCGVLLCVGMGYRILGFVYFECGVLLSVGMGYCILEGFSVVTVVSCCASVWCTVYWRVLCIVTVVCSCTSVWGTVCWGFCAL